MLSYLFSYSSTDLDHLRKYSHPLDSTGDEPNKQCRYGASCYKYVVLLTFLCRRYLGKTTSEKVVEKQCFNRIRSFRSTKQNLLLRSAQIQQEYSSSIENDK